MKKLSIVMIAAMMTVSCSPMAKLINTATHSKSQAVQPTAAIFADLDVSTEKISYFYIPSKTVAIGGYDNIINTAVREALAANGNADVLVALETQVKYNSAGVVESVVITGYPAKYTNFRNANDEVLSKLVQTPAESTTSSSPFGALKLGKK